MFTVEWINETALATEHSTPMTVKAYDSGTATRLFTILDKDKSVRLVTIYDSFGRICLKSSY